LKREQEERDQDEARELAEQKERRKQLRLNQEGSSGKKRHSMTARYLEEEDNGRYDSTSLSALKKRSRGSRGDDSAEEYDDEEVADDRDDDMKGFIADDDEEEEDEEEGGEWQQPQSKRSRIEKKSRRGNEDGAEDAVSTDRENLHHRVV
jgi:hypothetical protein